VKPWHSTIPGRLSARVKPSGRNSTPVIGIENLLWGNDFPHSESTWPRSREFLATRLAGVPEEEVCKLTCDNAARIFHFSL